MKAEAMAKLFDVIEVEEVESDTSDYGMTASDNVSPRSFEERCEDVAEMMEEEEVTCKPAKSESDKHREIIATALEEAGSNSTPPPQSSDAEPSNQDEPLTDESGGQYANEVSQDMAEFEVEDDGVNSETGGSSPVSEPSPEPDPLDVIEDVVFTKVGGDNPLGLHGDDFHFYKECLQKYPQFTLYDGSVSFKEFYRYKVHMLRMILTKYPILDLADIREEISQLNIDHFLDEKMVITTDVIRFKIDESYRWRARLSDIMLRVIPQFYVWERWNELLESKLWKDHELKGAHRRFGLTMEHMSDITDYVGDLKGVMEMGKHADTILKAASESLSRQLSCLQLKEAMGTTQKGAEKIREQIKELGDLDGFDSIGPGERISAPSGHGVATTTFGVEADDLAMLG